MRTQAKYEDMVKTFTPEISVVLTNQRNAEIREFKNGEIELQIEGISGEYVSVRGKYPNDGWFATCYFSMLEETRKFREAK